MGFWPRASKPQLFGYPRRFPKGHSKFQSGAIYCVKSLYIYIYTVHHFFVEDWPVTAGCRTWAFILSCRWRSDEGPSGRNKGPSSFPKLVGKNITYLLINWVLFGFVVIIQVLRQVTIRYCNQGGTSLKWTHVGSSAEESLTSQLGVILHHQIPDNTPRFGMVHIGFPGFQPMTK